MRRILMWLISIPVLTAVVVFALNNRGAVALDLWPFGLMVEMPLYLAFLFTLGAGAVLGGFAAWAGQARARGALRDQAYQGEVARRELQTEREKTQRLEQELEAARDPSLRTAALEAPKPEETRLETKQETLPPPSSAGEPQSAA